METHIPTLFLFNVGNMTNFSNVVVVSSKIKEKMNSSFSRLFSHMLKAMNVQTCPTLHIFVGSHITSAHPMTIIAQHLCGALKQSRQKLLKLFISLIVIFLGKQFEDLKILTSIYRNY